MTTETQQDLSTQAKDSEFNAPRLNLSLKDFTILGQIGDGSFSSVFLCSNNETKHLYAIKMISKTLVIRNKMVDYIKTERHILDQLEHVGVAKLYFTFQDAESVYLGMEYCSGGDLYNQLSQQKKMSLKHAQFYAAEITLILEYLRSKQVVHRDLKPENLLLTEKGHLKLIDFGSAKAFFLPPELARNSKNRATSFVGTADYVSPEVLNNTGISYSADLWALGCVLFQMISGKAPFKAASEYLTFQLITIRDFTFTDDFPPAARDLVDKLLVLEPSERLGASNLADLKAHEFFTGINWDTIWDEEAPPFTPPVPPSDEDMALNWELTSLTRNEPVKYEYEQVNKPVSS